MYVGNKMLKVGNFPIVTPETLVVDAEKLMEEHRLWMLLVMKDRKLAGYFRKEDCLEVLPSRATTLSKHELNYLLSKLKVEKIMRKDVPHVLPQTEIEEAAHRMFVEDLAGLAVVDRKNNLLGFINRGVMLEVLVEEMGLLQGGSRVVFEVEDRTGVICEVSTIITNMGISIISTGTFFRNGKRIVVFRLKTEDPGPVIKELTNRGYKMYGPDDFLQELS